MKKKHKITLLVIGILLALSLMLSSSYALWVFNVSQESTNVLVSDCFEMTLTDSNPIGLGASFPMRDSDGVQTTPYTFTIRNICNHPADFQINLETLNTSTIDEEFIKADLNGRITEYNTAESVEPTIEGARSAAMLYEDTLAVNGEKAYNLRIWVNEIATQEDVENKSYASKVSVKAVVRKQYAEGTLVAGSSFNAALKKLADGGNPNCYTSNTSITSIVWSDNAPEESDNTVNLAETGTTIPIYAWFKDGIIYIYTTLDKIYMNPFSSNMFYKMKGVTSLDLSHFDTSNVTNMIYMFYGMSNLTNLDVSHFDTSKVTNMADMFGEMSNLTNLDVSHFNTSTVTNMSYMFYGMSNLTNLDVSHFDTSKVTSMTSMFEGMSNLTNLDVSHFDTLNVTSMSNMFNGMSSLTNLDVSHFDTLNVTSMSDMFNGMSNLTNLDVSHFNTSKVTNMSYMFNGMSNLTNLDLSNFDTSNVTNMSYMFCEMSNLTNLNVSNLNTSKVTNMNNMFSKISNLTNLDVSHFDTSNVESMYNMFGGMENITQLDVSNFNTSKVVSIGQMFHTMKKLEYLDLSNFDTSKVTSMPRMFLGTTNLSYLNISSFDTSLVTDMYGMFNGMSNITELDISSFDTSNVTSMSYMFNGMSNLKTIYVGTNWITESVTSSNSMFGSNTKLVGGSGTTYDGNHKDKEYARIDDPANGKPGYFTYKSA